MRRKSSKSRVISIILEEDSGEDSEVEVQTCADRPDGALLSVVDAPKDGVAIDKEEQELEEAHEAIENILVSLAMELQTRKEKKAMPSVALTPSSTSSDNSSEKRDDTCETDPEEIFEDANEVNDVDERETTSNDKLNDSDAKQLCHDLFEMITKCGTESEFLKEKGNILNLVSSLKSLIQLVPTPSPSTPAVMLPPPPPPPPPASLMAPKPVKFRTKIEIRQNVPDDDSARVKLREKSREIRQDLLHQLQNTLRKRKNRKSLQAAYQDLC